MFMPSTPMTKLAMDVPPGEQTALFQNQSTLWPKGKKEEKSACPVAPSPKKPLLLLLKQEGETVSKDPESLAQEQTASRSANEDSSVEETLETLPQVEDESTKVSSEQETPVVPDKETASIITAVTNDDEYSVGSSVGSLYLEDSHPPTRVKTIMTSSGGQKQQQHHHPYFAILSFLVFLVLVPTCVRQTTYPPASSDSVETTGPAVNTNNLLSFGRTALVTPNHLVKTPTTRRPTTKKPIIRPAVEQKEEQSSTSTDDDSWDNVLDVYVF